ncbi:hypothetical protein [Leeuwenhoekiella sp. H156]|uniref:hypothetical protein n=1 Tax=Leeuwenhoekiella sp. H156 TaxID=3450128 RepID=UPI003FA44030
MKTKILKQILFIPLSVITAYFFQETLFFVFDSKDFSSSFLVWLFTTFILMLTLASTVPTHKNECVKYSFQIILFYSIAYILFLASIWELNGSFSFIKISIPLGCLTGATLTFFLLKNNYPDSSKKTELIDSGPNFFLELLPAEKQQALKDEAQRAITTEYEAQGLTEYDISDQEITARAVKLFESNTHNEYSTPRKKKFSEVERAEAMERVAKRMQEDPEFRKKVEAMAAAKKN